MERFISRFLKYGTLFSSYCLIGSVLLQIFARFFLENTPTWTEEASRLFFIYAISFAAGLALKSQYYVHLDLIFARLSERAKKRLILATQFLTMILFITITIFSIPLMILGNAESSPSMGIKMSIAFFSIFLMAASLAYYTWWDLKRTIKKNPHP